MAALKCPHCDALMPNQRTWAEVAMSTLGGGPAVPDMATQVRCNNCGRVSAASDLRYVVADRFNTTRVLVWTVVVALLAWILIRLLSR